MSYKIKIKVNIKNNVIDNIDNESDNHFIEHSSMSGSFYNSNSSKFILPEKKQNKTIDCDGTFSNIKSFEIKEHSEDIIEKNNDTKTNIDHFMMGEFNNFNKSISENNIDSPLIEKITNSNTQDNDNKNIKSNISDENNQNYSSLNTDSFPFSGLTCNCIGLGFMCLHFISSLMYCGIDNEYESSSSFGFFGFLWCVLAISSSICFITNKYSRKFYGVFCTITTVLSLFSSFIGNIGILAVLISLILFSISMVFSLVKNYD